MLKIDGTTIRLTRGDSAWISIPIQTEAGEAYTIAAGDTLALHVRSEPVTGRGTDPILYFTGVFAADDDGVPLWHIMPAQSAIPVGSYVWDAQITLADGDVCTYAGGNLVIMPEVTRA